MKYYIVDRQYNLRDIQVITSYDITTVKRLYLSIFLVNKGGNRIGAEGFKCLTQRKFPYIKSIYLATNRIKDLSQIDEQNWRNI